jgi:hypothetical protein
MDSTFLLPMALVALFVAILVTAFEMRASLAPATCDECPHCQAAATERAQRERELQSWYAKTHGLDGDDDDDRRIG